MASRPFTAMNAVVSRAIGLSPGFGEHLCLGQSESPASFHRAPAGQGCAHLRPGPWILALAFSGHFAMQSPVSALLRMEDNGDIAAAQTNVR